ncbi:uncharacterized protein LOC103514057 [Diaphorina citri]|uniref:Uncharacterized protein LOC103514057 n=1 Tax=Diaphorina citri TaxID=121845 RepID=A0A3Q0J350_DIACI|nr:uncharacterized protein LOC103514057 [Diaphorina citri]
MVRTELKCKNELSRVLEEQHQRLNLSYEALYKEFTDAMAELTERKEELSQLNEAMTKMKQHNEVLKQIEVDFKTREQNLEQVVLEKLKSFESEVLEKTETISRLEEQNNKYEIQIKQLSEQIDAQSKDINQLRENIQVKNEEIKQLREDIYVKNEEITRLNEDIQVKNEGISRLKDKLTTVEHADNSMNTGYDILCTDKKSPDTTSIINAQEILSLLEINSAHCKRYHALEKAYRELSLECSALHRTLSASPALSAPPSACLSNECSAYVSQIKKLSEENKYLQATLSDYKRINSLLLDQIKVSVHHPVLEDSLPPQTLLNTRYNIAEKEDNSSTLSVDDRNTADLWWENEVNIPHALTYDNLPCTETKSL